MRVMAPDQRRARLGKLFGNLLLAGRCTTLIFRAPMDGDNDYSTRLARRPNGLGSRLDVEYTCGIKGKEGEPDPIDDAVYRFGARTDKAEPGSCERGLSFDQSFWAAVEAVIVG